MIYDCDEMHAKWCTIGYEMHARSCMIGTNCVHGRGDCIMTRNCMLETGDLYKTRRRKKNCMHKRSKCHHEPRKNTKMTKETKKKREHLEPQSFQLENHTTRPTPQILPRSTFYRPSITRQLGRFRTPYSSTPHTMTHRSTSYLHSFPHRPSDARHQTTITHTAYTALRDIVHIALVLHS